MSKKEEEKIDDFEGEIPCRIHEMSNKEIHEVRKVRQEHGDKQYGDAHMSRYNLLDVLEEVLDAQNILELYSERISRTDMCKGSGFWEKFREVKKDLKSVRDDLKRLDLFVSDYERLEDVVRIGINWEDNRINLHKLDEYEFTPAKEYFDNWVSESDDGFSDDYSVDSSGNYYEYVSKEDLEDDEDE